MTKAFKNVTNGVSFEQLGLDDKLIHSGESGDILYLYSDRTGKNIFHYFSNTQ